MTEEQQRIAIAETCGWRIETRRAMGYGGETNAIQYYWEKNGCVGSLPDYLNDLNAMHEAEKENDMHFNQKWVEAIVDIAVRESSFEFNRTEGWDWVLLVSRLTSAQRAEAFLRTIGKWTNNQPTEP